MASSCDSSNFVDAGFWLRVAAALTGCSMGASGSTVEEIQSGVLLPSCLLGIVANLAYYAGMESSPRQATLGKSAMGLIVTTVDRDRITFGRAPGRFLPSICRD